MKKKDVFESVPAYWTTTDLDNLFDIQADSDGRLFFNLNESVYLRAPKSALRTYECQYARMHWPLISHVLYGTTRLAWLLMKLNGVGAEEQFMPKFAADRVLYLDKSYIMQIAKAVNGYE